MAATVFGIFEDWEHARRALDRLHEAGFNAQETNVIGAHGLTDPALDTDSTRYFSGTDHSAVEDGATIGAVTGAVFGGAAGWALGLTLLAIPGVGPVMVAGPILAGLAGFLAGGGAGGFIGSMTGMGVPEAHADLYNEHLGAGRIVLSVPNTDHPEEARTLLESAGAIETHQHAVDGTLPHDTVSGNMPRADISAGVHPGNRVTASVTPGVGANDVRSGLSTTTVPAVAPISGNTPLDEDEERPVAAATINRDSAV